MLWYVLPNYVCLSIKVLSWGEIKLEDETSISTWFLLQILFLLSDTTSLVVEKHPISATIQSFVAMPTLLGGHSK